MTGTCPDDLFDVPKATTVERVLHPAGRSPGRTCSEVPCVHSPYDFLLWLGDQTTGAKGAYSPDEDAPVP